MNYNSGLLSIYNNSDSRIIPEFSPEGRRDQNNRYAFNEKKRNKSKGGNSKRFNQTSLIRNKDYKCIIDDNVDLFSNLH